MDMWLFMTTFAQWISSAVRLKRTNSTTTISNFTLYDKSFPDISLEVFRFLCFTTDKTRFYMSVLLPPLLVPDSLRKRRLPTVTENLPLDDLLDRNSFVFTQLDMQHGDYFHTKVSLQNNKFVLQMMMSQINGCAPRKIDTSSLERVLQPNGYKYHYPGLDCRFYQFRKSISTNFKYTDLPEAYHFMKALITHWNYETPLIIGRADMSVCEDFENYRQRASSSWQPDRLVIHENLLSEMSVPSLTGWILSSIEFYHKFLDVYRYKERNSEEDLPDDNSDMDENPDTNIAE